MSAAAERRLRELLAIADVEIGGGRSWDVVVHDPRAFKRILRSGSLGAGETYMEGWWDCERLDELAAKVLNRDFLTLFRRKPGILLAALAEHLYDRQAGARARAIADQHYDLGNEFFRAMLGPTMTYSGAYWRSANGLDRAQEDKLELACRKLQLRAGEHVLDIGCGWGSFARHAAARHGCRVTAITISAEQAAYARRWCQGLPVEVLLMDYREPDLAARGPFDKIVSIGMFEHVGRRNLRRFMCIVRDVLAPGGLFLLHTIGKLRGLPDLWVSRYIFPNSHIPTLREIGRAIEGLFVMEDWHNFGADYDRTLLAWHENFEHHVRAGNCPGGERFRRMWRYYLLTSAGCFRSRTLHLWQIVLSARGVPGGYVSVR